MISLFLNPRTLDGLLVVMTAVFGLLAFGVGVVLGLLGGGGSLLTVPFLVYVVGLQPETAIPLSLLVVGSASTIALLPHVLHGRVHFRVGWIFGGAGTAGGFLGGRLGGSLSQTALMTAFGALLVVTAIALLRPPAASNAARPRQVRLVFLLVTGFFVGLVAGVLGAGGGFLIVPALVLWGGLGVRSAMGTSLFVIALQSFAAFFGHAGPPLPAAELVVLLAVAAALGSVWGASLSARLPQEKLRHAFASLVLVLGASILGFLATAGAAVALLFASAMLSGIWATRRVDGRFRRAAPGASQSG